MTVHFNVSTASAPQFDEQVLLLAGVTVISSTVILIFIWTVYLDSVLRGNNMIHRSLVPFRAFNLPPQDHLV